jgi:hypothetical protein
MSSSPATATAAAPRSYRPPGPVVIEIENVTKLYKMGEEIVHALRGVALTVRRNEYLAVIRVWQIHDDEHAGLPGYPDDREVSLHGQGCLEHDRR